MEPFVYDEERAFRLSCVKSMLKVMEKAYAKAYDLNKLEDWEQAFGAWARYLTRPKKRHSMELPAPADSPTLDSPP